MWNDDHDDHNLKSVLLEKTYRIAQNFRRTKLFVVRSLFEYMKKFQVCIETTSTSAKTP